MRSFPVVFKKVISARGSDFGGTPEDSLADIGPESDSVTRGLFTPTLYAPGATVRHLTNEEKVAGDLAASQEAIELTCVFTPILEKVNAHDNVVIFKEDQYKILSIDRTDFGNRKIKFVIGRLLK